MYTINTFSISKLNNAEITGFFINLQRTMTSPEDLVSHVFERQLGCSVAVWLKSELKEL